MLLVLAAAPVRGQGVPADTGIVQGGVTANTEPCPECYAVDVSPDGQPVTHTSGTTQQATFTVTNIGTSAGAYSLTCSTTGTLACLSVNPSSVNLAPEMSASVTVSYSLAGSGGVLTLLASGSSADQGSYGVTGQPPALVQRAPVVAVAHLNPGGLVPRNACVTISLGSGTAWECGALRVVHSLPPNRVFGRSRTPYLLYSSATAHPMPVVQADVSIPFDALRPDAISAKLFLGTELVAERTWSQADWLANSVKRISLSFDGAGRATGLYGYRLEVASVYASSRLAVEVQGELAIVNNQSSYFGAGWWLAGLERLVLGGGHILRVSGDGSVVKYVPAGDGRWAGMAFTEPDTLYYDSDEEIYWTADQLNTRVYFDATGRHTETRNRHGIRTMFGYRVDGKLASIQTLDNRRGMYPAPYVFNYDGAGSLTSINAPSNPTPGQSSGTRVTELEMNSGRLYSVKDPTHVGVVWVRFRYDPADPALLVQRIDRRYASQTFTFGPALVVRQASQHDPSLVEGDPPGPLLWSRTFRLTDSLGLDGARAVDTANTVFEYDGPRPASSALDVTRFWLDRFGAPRKITDAAGTTTRLVRADARWPGTVTELVHHNGWRVKAWYNERGRVTQVTNEGRTGLLFGAPDTARTTYAWTQFGSGMGSEMSERRLPHYEVARFGRDGVGDVSYVEDGRGLASRWTFAYNLSGGITSADGPVRGAQTFTYDHVDNLAGSTTALGSQVQYFKDGFGRDTLVRTSISAGLWQEEKISYDLRERVVERRTSGPGTSAPGVSLSNQTLTVRYSYDLESNVLSVQRRSDPDLLGIGWVTTQYAYDGAGRKVREIAPDGQSDSTGYDEAGNVVFHRSRRGLVVTAAYDASNRLITRSIPSAAYPRVTTSWYSADAPEEPRLRGFPQFPNAAGGGYTVPSDVETFSYDAMGRLITADNAFARIRRTYTLDGLLETDSLSIRTWEPLSTGGNFTTHRYGIRHRHDLNGRPTSVQHPAQLVTDLLTDSTSYQYHGVTGLPLSVRDPLNSVYSFRHDGEGRVDSLMLPGNKEVRQGFDADGQLVTYTLIDRIGLSGPNYFPVTTLKSVSLTYDLRGKLLTLRDTGLNEAVADMAYSGLGALIWLRSSIDAPPSVQFNAEHRWTSESIRPSDGLGHLMASGTRQYANGLLLVRDTTTASVQVGTGRLLQDMRVHDRHAEGQTVTPSVNDFDASGNIQVTRDTLPGQLWTRTHNYYGADERLRAVDRRQNLSLPTFEEYWYDALGRRILVRSIQRPNLNAFNGSWAHLQQPPLVSKIRRVVWSGDRVLHEIQAPGADTLAAGVLENDTAPVQHAGVWWRDQSYYFGRVTYVHGEELDRPLGIIRQAYGEVINRVNGSSPGTPQYVPFVPFLIVPHWDTRGMVDNGSFGSGERRRCSGVVDNEGKEVCVRLTFEPSWQTAETIGSNPLAQWHGSLLADHRDDSGNHFRRNRYYDPATGRWTQEDPIGIAGGLNTYGFAQGDPVSYGDPFGLCPVCLVAYAVFEIGATAYDLYDFGRTAIDYSQGKVGKAELGITAAGVGVGLFGFGGGYGRAAREALELGFKGVTNVAEQLAFRELATGVRAGSGVVLAGGTHKVAFRQAEAFAAQYGGTAADYVKKTTTQSVTSGGGSKVHQIHWVENVRTGAIYDVKLTTQAVK